MKKRCIAIVLCWVLIVSILLPFRKKAYADALTASIIAGTSFGLMNYWGISFNAFSASGIGMENFLVNEINDYANTHGSSLADLFGTEVVTSVAGKLAIGYQLYNGIKNFVNWLSDKFGLSNQDSTLSEGSPFGIATITEVDETVSETGISCIQNGNNIFLYYNGNYVAVSTFKWNGPSYLGMEVRGLQGYTLEVNENGKTILTTHWLCEYIPKSGGDWQVYINTNSTTTNLTAIMEDAISWNGSNYVEPTVLNPDKGWVGDFGLDPDTNLDQLIQDIFEDVADNNLDVDGEIIDAPVPPGPVPTWTPVDDVIDGINQTGEILEGIGNDIGDISGHLDDIGDQLDDVTGALEGVQEGIQTQTGVISGAIDQATQDVVDAIEEQTATLDQTMTETAEGVQDIAEALQPGEIEPKKFDLRGLFPFCIPFDIHNLLQKFQATPVAPHVQLPFVIQSIGFSYTFDLDFSAFDSVAAVMRTVEFIVFAIGLAWATSKVIKW